MSELQRYHICEHFDNIYEKIHMDLLVKSHQSLGDSSTHWDNTKKFENFLYSIKISDQLIEKNIQIQF